jgi:hypothetical protein
MSSSMMNTPHAYYPYARWRLLPLESVTLTDGFWAHRQDINRRVTIPHGYQMLEQTDNLDNLRIAAGQIEGKFRGMVFQDSDVYKWLEAVGYALHLQPDPALQQQADSAIDLVAAAQMPDGYINSHIQVAAPNDRWADMDFGHELYCAGHLFQAAAAYTRATHTTKLLGIATRFADLLVATFGPDKRQGTSGHPEIETALVELYRVTGKPEYLALTRFFIDQRGKGVMRGIGWMKAEYHQDRVPVRQAETVEGHAVRAMYLNAGVTDLYLETGEEALLAALDRQWRSMAGSKLFITGGLGSRYEGEAFGDEYELPSDRCYCETCAAIGSVMWNLRMLLVTGDSRYADLMEHTLFNSVLSGISLDGQTFFYMNPLLSRGDYARKPWYEVACCPPNLMRLFGSLGQYVATYDGSGLQIHLYTSGIINASLSSGQPVSIAMQTEYPWQGRVKLTVKTADGSRWALRLRRPGWCPEAAVTVNEQPVDPPVVDVGYFVLDRAWQTGDVVELDLPMQPELIEAHPRVDAVRDSAAIQRGPLVYCLEATDHPHVNIMDIRVNETIPLQAVWRDDLAPGGLMAIQCSGYVLNQDEWQGRLYRRLSSSSRGSPHPLPLTAVPYFAWANRGPNAMRVWIPLCTPAVMV